MENICAAADIIKGRNIGADEFTFSVYPASTPIYMELVKNGAIADLMEAGTVVKTAFCGPCFGAGDTPANNAFSIRHSTRNFPNREGSKIQNGQISSIEQSNSDSPEYFDYAWGALYPQIMGNQSADGIDTASGATFSSEGILGAVQKALAQALA